MAKIDTIDRNFQIKTNIDKADVVYHSIATSPFSVHGVFYADGKYRRLPEAVAKTVSPGVYGLHANTAGGRVRFRTNSPYVALYAEMGGLGKMPHFTILGSCGFDMYAKVVENDIPATPETYVKSFMPPFDLNQSYESVIDFTTQATRDITIHFPLYSEVKRVYIGLAEGAMLCEATPYAYETPIVYYGSSITQGGCASRPGNSYQSIISRALDTDYINLGFSGNAKGEPTIVNYIKGLAMSMFVCDYDYNAPSPEHLLATHEPLYHAVREAHPSIPIIMMCRPYFLATEDSLKRHEIIKRTYENAISQGDKHVYMISGRELMQLAQNDGTVDGVHPTDLGFFSMAQALIPIIERILHKN